MIFRPAEISDMPDLLSMVDGAKMRFKERGIDQWQKGDPSEEEISEIVLLSGTEAGAHRIAYQKILTP